MIYDFFWHNDEFALSARLWRPDGQGGKTSALPLYVAPCELKLEVVKKTKQSKNDVVWQTKLMHCEESAMTTGVIDGHVTKMVGSSLWALADFSLLDTNNEISVGIYRLKGNISLPFSWVNLNLIEKIKGPSWSGPGKFHDNNWLRDVQGDEENFVLKWAGYGET